MSRRRKRTIDDATRDLARTRVTATLPAGQVRVGDELRLRASWDEVKATITNGKLVILHLASGGLVRLAVYEFVQVRRLL